MSSGDFWSRKLGVTAPPPGQPMPSPTTPATAGAWWQPSPVAVHAQVPPEAMAPRHSVMPTQEDYQTLKGMRADEMTAEQMEALAEIELAFDKYNQACPQCQSTNFIPQGTKIGTQRMGTDKCFDCGNSSSTLTASPEPAVGASSNKAGKATRQTAHGGQGFNGRHHSQLPTQYVPRRA